MKKLHNERVADDSKTIDHIVDVNKKVSLTEQWEKGELEDYKKYYCKTKWFEDIFQARCYNKDTKGEWWCLENEKYRYNNIFHNKDIEVLALAPSYEEWRSLQSSWVDEMDKATRFKKALDDVCEEYNSKLPILEAETQRLKELLKECVSELAEFNNPYYPKTQALITKINEVLND